MVASLLAAIALLAQGSGAATSSGPVSGTAQPTPPSVPVKAGDGQAKAGGGAAKTAEGCSTARPSADTREIVVCAPRPQGYRIDPDILEAKRAMRGGRPKRPERLRDNSCASVGPMGCRGAAGIDLVGAAMLVGTMAVKAVRGENVGKMFVTDPQRSEYDYYVEAKRLREAREAEVAAAAKAKAAKAAKGSARPATASEHTPKP